MNPPLRSFLELPAARVLLMCGAILASMTEVAAQARSFAVIKCKFSDQRQEPEFDPQLITGGTAAYWSAISYGRISLNGSAVFPASGGWYTLPFTLAESVSMTRDQKIDACIAAAAEVDTSKFYSVVAIINAQIDSGAASGRILLDPLAWNISFAAHEMGHVFTLDHSFDDSNTSYDPNSDSRPGAYGNSWDIMSAMTFGNVTTTFNGPFGVSGPGMNGPTLEKLGWMPTDRVVTWDGGSSTVTLAALNQPLVSGALMIKVPLANSEYTVEFRRKKDWDQGIPNDAVLIHEVRADGLSYLIRGSGGPERLPGRTFHDPRNNVAITVISIDPIWSTAVVNIGRSEVWVDFNHNGSETGAFANPFNTLAEGLNAVAIDGTLNIKAGSRNETATVSRKMRIQAFGGPVTIGR